MAAAVARELEAVGRLDSVLGQVALLLAGRIDVGVETGSGMASLTRELRATMQAATAGAAGVDRLGELRDDLRSRRHRHAAGAS